MPIIQVTVISGSIEDGEFVGKQINDVVGRKLSEITTEKPKTAKLLCHGKELVRIRVFAGKEVLSEEAVTALGKKVVKAVRGKKKIILCVFPHKRCFITGVGEL